MGKLGLDRTHAILGVVGAVVGAIGEALTHVDWTAFVIAILGG